MSFYTDFSGGVGWEGDMPTMSFRTTQVSNTPLEFYDINLKNYQANKIIQF